MYDSSVVQSLLLCISMRGEGILQHYQQLRLYVVLNGKMIDELEGISHGHLPSMRQSSQKLIQNNQCPSQGLSHASSELV